MFFKKIVNKLNLKPIPSYQYAYLICLIIFFRMISFQYDNDFWFTINQGRYVLEHSFPKIAVNSIHNILDCIFHVLACVLSMLAGIEPSCANWCKKQIHMGSTFIKITGWSVSGCVSFSVWKHEKQNDFRVWKHVLRRIAADYQENVWNNRFFQIIYIVFKSEPGHICT